MSFNHSLLSKQSNIFLTKLDRSKISKSSTVKGYGEGEFFSKELNT